MRRLVALLAPLLVARLAAADVLAIDPDGAPVPGAQVHGTAPDLCVSAPGFVPAAIASPEFAPPPIVLARAAAIRGRATTPTGAPAPGVRLEVADDTGACARHGESGADGAFLVDGLEPRSTARLRVVTPETFLPSRASLSARAGSRLDVIVLPAVRPEIAVSGADGKRLAGATVTLERRWDRIQLAGALDPSVKKDIDDFEGTTDEKGVVRLPVLPRAAGWRVVVRHPAHAPASIALDLRSGGSAASVALKDGGTLVVRGLDETAAPRRGLVARLTSSTAQDADLVPEPKPAGGDGILKIEHVPAGRYEAELRAPGAKPRLLRGLAIQDAAVTDAGDVTLEPGVTLAGIVLGDGSPLRDAKVFLWTRAEGARLKLEARTGSDGSFAFEGLDPDETADVKAESPGWTSDRLRDVPAESSDVTIEMQRTASLVASVLDAATREPVDDVEIGLVDDDGRFEALEATADREHPGEWIVTDLRPRARDIAARSAGYAMETKRDVQLAAGDRARVAFEMARGESLQGRVVDEETGAGLAQASVSAESLGVRATTGTDGTFTLEGLRSPFDLVARRDGYVTLRRPLVDAGQAAESGLTLPLARGGAVEGTVFGPSGAPLAGAAVSEGGGDDIITGPDGRYRIDGLAPGPHQLTKTDRPGTFDGFESVAVDIVKGQAARRDFGLGSRITGVITHRGEPARGVDVGAMLVPDGSDPIDGLGIGLAAASTDADGRYSISVDRPGTHCLTIAWRGQRFGRLVTVPEGVPMVTEDIAIPDIHLAGRVVDADTGEPLGEVHVSLQSKAGPQPSSSMSTGLSESDSEGNVSDLLLNSLPQAAFRTGADGQFTLLVDRPGPSKLEAWKQGYDPWTSPDDFAVTETREGFTISMTGKAREQSAQVRITLRDAASGSPIGGTIIAITQVGGDASSNSVNIQSGSATATVDAPEEGGTLMAIGWVEGRGVAIRQGIGPSDEDVVVDLPLSAGGSVRILVPEGALQPDRMRGFTGPLTITIPPGLEMATDLNLQMNVLAKMIAQEGPGTWILRDLPAGPVTLRLGEGMPRTVEVAPGDTIEADLR